MEEHKECIFCKIANGEIPSEKVYEDDNFFAILDINPKTKGHTLIISKKHYKTILDLPVSLGNELLEALKEISLRLIKEGKADGFNLIANSGETAGQVVHHFHAHILPRKKGDGFKMSV